MHCLLDTHTLVWWWLSDPKLSDRAREAISASDNRISVSAVSAFEIANKVRRGKLPAMQEPLAMYDLALTQEGFVDLPIEPRHARHAGLLSGEHRDPFDRLIAAQALLEDLVVITRDHEVAAFGCTVLW